VVVVVVAFNTVFSTGPGTIRDDTKTSFVFSDRRPNLPTWNKNNGTVLFTYCGLQKQANRSQKPGDDYIDSRTQMKKASKSPEIYLE
jgi:hypothetical protein